MTAEWWILLAGQIITVLGLGGVGWTIKAMKGTVDTQEKTISALRTILDAADVPKMAERFKAYRELVDHEKEAEVKKLAARVEQEKARLAEGSKMIAEGMQTLIGSIMGLGTYALPYVPKERRQEFIQEVRIPGPVGEVLREVFGRYAEEAPDLNGLSIQLEVLGKIRDRLEKVPTSKLLGPPNA
jgi:hypothetical protein